MDISLLEGFSKVFVFIFIFVVIYAILILTKLFGENKSLASIISLSMAVIFMFSEKAINMIVFSVPWFILLGIGIMLILLNYKLLGGEGNIVSMLIEGQKHKVTVYWIIILSIVIVIIGLGNNFGQNVGPYLDGDNQSIVDSATSASDNLRGSGDVDTGDFQTNLGATLFHPKILGLALILAIAGFTILFIASN